MQLLDRTGRKVNGCRRPHLACKRRLLDDATQQHRSTGSRAGDGEVRGRLRVNAAGADNKYMVSAYSLPEQIASPQGGGAVYTYEGGKSGGAYAQCDGGLCFKSTEETTFPGFDSRCRRSRSSVPARSRTPAPAAGRAIRSSRPMRSCYTGRMVANGSRVTKIAPWRRLAVARRLRRPFTDCGTRGRMELANSEKR